MMATRALPTIRVMRPEGPTGGSPSLRLVAERRFQAMGTAGHVIVHGDGRGKDGPSQRRLNALADGAVGRIHDLESSWSRFRPGSEISRLNDRRQLRLSVDAFCLVERAVRAWQSTNGRFNPTMGRLLEEAGYDRSIEQLAAHPPATGEEVGSRQRPDRSAPDCAGIALDRFTGMVCLPDGVVIDPGGIGKGLAADLVSGELVATGAAGALVNLGGDLAARGRPPQEAGWLVSVDEPAIANDPVTSLLLRSGAVATSTPLRRRWGPPASQKHHLLDPATGRCSRRGPDLVTVVAGQAWWAEAAATALASSPAVEPPVGPIPVGQARARLHPSLPNVEALVVWPGGIEERTAGFAAYEGSRS